MKTERTIGICAHSFEGGALCFLAACRERASLLGPHMHPNIILSAVPMGSSMPAWESDDHDEVARHLKDGIEQVAKAGANFFIFPDNTAHIVLEKIVADLPIPGLHIAGVVCREIDAHGWKKVGLLGTNWTAVRGNGWVCQCLSDQRRPDVPQGGVAYMGIHRCLVGRSSARRLVLLRNR